jgi:hypothetical protein
MVQSVQPPVRWLWTVSSALRGLGAAVLPGLSACLRLRSSPVGTGPGLLGTRWAGQGARPGTRPVVEIGDISHVSQNCETL